MDGKQAKDEKNDMFDFFFLVYADYIDTRPAENVLIDKSTYLLIFDKKWRDSLKETRNQMEK